jgi:hypothetical protein
MTCAGFVVAMVNGEDRTEPEDSGAALDVDYRDVEFAIPARSSAGWDRPVVAW